MKKKLTLTEDHIKLIKNIKFETFELGDLYDISPLVDAINEIENSNENMRKFGKLRDYLNRAQEHLEVLSDKKECHAWGINQWNLFGGTYVMEDVAMILGHYGDFVPGTEESPLGKQYPKELEDYWWGLYLYIVENLVLIISLIFNYMDKGGITAGDYQVNTDGMVWEKIDNSSKEEKLKRANSDFEYYMNKMKEILKEFPELKKRLKSK
jgi:hypothetical protein